MRKLRKRWSPDRERGGFILPDGAVIEVDNIAETPAEAFVAHAEDIMRHANTSVALWHTHTGESAHLSAEDWKTFVSWPGYEHIIVSSQSIRFYAVSGPRVLNVDTPKARSRNA